MPQENLSMFSDNDLNSQILPDTELSDKVIYWLADLYYYTDWQSVILGKEIDREYDGVPIVSYLKALALPYLVNIPSSESALARLILMRNNLRKLCGFVEVGSSGDSDRPVLGLRSFWHFRAKYKEIYSELMTKVLISLVLGRKYPNLNLPFVEKIEENEFNSNGNLVQWFIDPYRTLVIISLPEINNHSSAKNEQEMLEEWQKEWKEKFRQTTGFNEFQSLKEKYDEEFKAHTQIYNRGFIDEISFPIDVSTSLASKERLVFRLVKPDWQNKDVDEQELSILRRDNIKLSENTYDKACNILVVRKMDSQIEILLSRRRAEGVGKGTFATPGGKQHDGETLEECAIRELEEETGLIMKKSRPISLYYTLQRSGKQIMSVGVLAEAWTGEIKTKEPNKHQMWKWFNLDSLPTPIFEFSEIAIAQFREKKYPNLVWEDVEERPDRQLPLFN